MRATDIDLKSYVSPFPQNEGEEDFRIIFIVWLILINLASNPFTSTILFLDDLYIVAEDLIKKQLQDKQGYIQAALSEINKKLPACVYMPFVNSKPFIPTFFLYLKDSLRYYAILNIVVDETRIFSTKERAPFYICLEVFRPQEYI